MVFVDVGMILGYKGGLCTLKLDPHGYRTWSLQMGEIQQPQSTVCKMKPKCLRTSLVVHVPNSLFWDICCTLEIHSHLLMVNLQG